MTIKHDKNKPRPTLVLKSMASAIEAVIEVGEHGAKKYADDNWLTVPDSIMRYTNAMLRHQQAEFMGEIVDRDSGLQHAAHAAWNALARLELMLREQIQSPSAVFPNPKSKAVPNRLPPSTIEELATRIFCDAKAAGAVHGATIDDSDEPWPSDRPHSFGPHAPTVSASTHRCGCLLPRKTALDDDGNRVCLYCNGLVKPANTVRVTEKATMWGRAYADAYALTPDELSELIGRIGTRLRRP